MSSKGLSRVGGATFPQPNPRPFVHGLSPRGRGNRWPTGRWPPPGRSIPAWAGQPSDEYIYYTYSKVYPRVGGATVPALTLPRPGEGLSPRGRGNPHKLFRRHSRQRSIPAWAGQPPRRPGPNPTLTVYPRVGGATVPMTQPDENEDGLSPRGRGNLPVALAWRQAVGSIPAWAGQPAGRPPALSRRGVYPRVGGATSQRAPFGRGRMGLSPRGRGNRPPQALGSVERRSIPAWAGQPAWARGSSEP